MRKINGWVSLSITGIGSGMLASMVGFHAYNHDWQFWVIVSFCAFVWLLGRFAKNS